MQGVHCWRYESELIDQHRKRSQNMTSPVPFSQARILPLLALPLYSFLQVIQVISCAPLVRARVMGRRFGLGFGPGLVWTSP